MPICTRRGCGQDQTSASPCHFHPGRPVFHEGLKSWSCCEKINKPVMEFDQFLAIPGCEVSEDGRHCDVKQGDGRVEEGERKKVDDEAPQVRVDEDGKEIYGAPTTSASKVKPSNSTNSTADAMTDSVTQTMSAATLAAKQSGAAAAAAAEPKEEEEDPSELDEKLVGGSVCKRKGCGFKFQGGGEKRDRSKEVCKHHAGVAVFHEGSKGYTCCKRRVLDFADFLQIEPCTTSSKGHLFFGAAPLASSKKKGKKGSGDGVANDGEGEEEEESVECRLDWYETPSDVRVTVYAKAVEEEKSKVEFKEDEVHLSLLMSPLPSSPTQLKRKHSRTLRTFASLDVSSSSFRVSKMKVELVLVKAVKGQSWPVLESTERVFGYGSTFGRHQ